MSPFPKVAKRKLGYSIAEVDLLIARARDQYSNASARTLDWRELSSHKFSMEKAGYQTAAVDAALEKLQDTFAARDLAQSSNQPADLRIALLGRVSRPKGKKFRRVGVLGLGYSRAAVDALISVVEEYLEGQEKLSIDEVRDLKFKLQRGGYIESQVDSYIDRLVEYIQAERFGRPFVAPAPSASNVVWGYPDPTDPGFQAY